VAAELGAGDKLTVCEASYTLEADLLAEPTNAAVIREIYLKQHPRSAHKWDEIATAANPAEMLYRKLRANQKFISKGEFAHDLAVAVQDDKPFVTPAYLHQAVTAALTEPGEPGAPSRSH
jgi:putative ATP-dependent endonuclease of OLD family